MLFGVAAPGFFCIFKYISFILIKFVIFSLNILFF